MLQCTMRAECEAPSLNFQRPYKFVFHFKRKCLVEHSQDEEIACATCSGALFQCFLANILYSPSSTLSKHSPVCVVLTYK